MAQSEVLNEISKEGFNMEYESPFSTQISLAPIYEYWQGKLSSKNKIEKLEAQEIMKLVEKNPALIEAIEDFNFVVKHADEIAQLTSHLFPGMLQNNEIKAIGMPFNKFYFNPTERFAHILDTASVKPTMEFTNFSHEHMYVFASVFTLGFAHGKIIDFKRPSFLEFIDEQGVRRVYRVLVNADFARITKTERSPEITEADIKKLQENFNDIELWKEKFPPESYDFSGFLLMNLVDVTAEQSLSDLKDALLEKNSFFKDNVILQVKDRFKSIFSIPDLEVGITNYDVNNDSANAIINSDWKSLILDQRENIRRDELFCSFGKNCLFTDHETLILNDLNDWVKWSTNPTYKTLLDQGIQSYLGVPLMKEDRLVGLLEFGAKNPYQLNSVVANKLEDIGPIFNVAAARAIEEYENEINAIIQEQCTAVHPSVYWKFAENAREVLDVKRIEERDIEIGEIKFNNVVPLFGQLDIKGSSIARSTAIQKDLIRQFELAVDVFNKAKEFEHLPIYKERKYQLKKCLKSLKRGLKAGDENRLLEFLQQEIYPVFSHLKSTDPVLEEAIQNYSEAINPQLNMIYEERKKYEDSVSLINENLSLMLDSHQDKAQKMFPHYFEKYKTDGVEFNAYIGQSIVQNKEYNPIYLKNLRLWQLEAMIDMERQIKAKKKEMPMPLDVASLILVHSSPMAIKFRTDEKKFDVDGAYNVRYEIIKKRIDKAHIKGTDERITQVGKISVIYSNEVDAKEYSKFFEYLASKGLVDKNIERLDIEELPGAAGLKALRASILYNNSEEQLSKTTVKDIIGRE